jgi:hypothetical protein
MRFCAHCASVLNRARSDARYCSSPCRQKGYRARKAGPTTPTNGLRTASEQVRSPSPRKTPEAIPEPILGPRHPHTGKIIDIMSLIG